MATTDNSTMTDPGKRFCEYIPGQVDKIIMMTPKQLENYLVQSRRKWAKRFPRGTASK